MLKRSVHLATFAVGALFVVSSSANAGSLGLSAMKLPPDIISTGLTSVYNYDAGTNVGDFTVTGLIGFGSWSVVGAPGIDQAIDNNPGYPTTLVDGFTLHAHMNGAGALLDGTVTITGELDDSSFNMVKPEGTIVSGTLSAFGYVSNVGGNPSLEFTFTPGAGTLDLGPKGGIILTLFGASPNPVDFGQSFRDSGASTADTFAVSVPSPAASWAGSALLGCLGLLNFRRNRAASN